MVPSYPKIKDFMEDKSSILTFQDLMNTCNVLDPRFCLQWKAAQNNMFFRTISSLILQYEY